MSAALVARLWVASSGRESSGLAALDVILLSIVPGILVVLGVLLWYGWRVSASLPELRRRYPDAVVVPFNLDPADVGELIDLSSLSKFPRLLTAVFTSESVSYWEGVRRLRQVAQTSLEDASFRQELTPTIYGDAPKLV